MCAMLNFNTVKGKFNVISGLRHMMLHHDFNIVTHNIALAFTVDLSGEKLLLLYHYYYY